jgi:hypothetical protein
LIQPVARLGQQTCVLHRDDRLPGEVLKQWRILNKILDRKAMPTRKVSTLGVNVRDASAKITRGV